MTENLYATLRQIRTGRTRSYDDVDVDDKLPEDWESTPLKEWSKFVYPGKTKRDVSNCSYGLMPCAHKSIDTEQNTSET